MLLWLHIDPGFSVKVYLSVAHDASDSIQLQILVVEWKSNKCNRAVLSGSINYLWKHNEHMFRSAETILQFYFEKVIGSVIAHHYLLHVHVCFQLSQNLRRTRRTSHEALNSSAQTSTTSSITPKSTHIHHAFIFRSLTSLN